MASPAYMGKPVMESDLPGSTRLTGISNTVIMDSVVVSGDQDDIEILVDASTDVQRGYIIAIPSSTVW